MRYTSLAVELLRSRPGLVVWSVLLALAALWFFIPVIFYGSPPGDLARVIAIGREYQVGSPLGPPLAFWLTDAAFWLAGKNMAGVYLLAQISFVVTFWAMFTLARSIVGAQHGVLAILLTLTIPAFSFPGVEFGPDVLARPLAALTLLHYWRTIGEGRRSAWFALSIEIALLLLTSMTGWLLVALLACFALATPRGRAAFASTDPLYALVVIVVILAPYLIWLFLPGSFAGLLPAWPSNAQILDHAKQWPVLFGAALMLLAGIVLVVAFNSGRFSKEPDEAPLIYRAEVDPFARLFVYVFAAAPLIAMSLIAAFFGAAQVPGGGVLLLMCGLAVVLLGGDLIYLRQQRQLRLIWAAILIAPALYIVGHIVVAPWLGGAELQTALPARDIGTYFADNFARRTGKPLPAVAGDPQLATLVALGAPSRPHVFFDALPKSSPWIDSAAFHKSGGLVVWRAADSAGQPPADIKARFPNLTAEVPRVFEWTVQGRRPLLRMGWAIIRPVDAATLAPPPSASAPLLPKPPAK